MNPIGPSADPRRNGEESAAVHLSRFLAPRRPETVRPGGKIEHGEHHSVVDDDKAIGRACAKASVLQWSSHQLRHLAAQLTEREVSIEGVRAYLGQKTVKIAVHYSGIDLKAAAEVAKRIG